MRFSGMLNEKGDNQMFILFGILIQKAFAVALLVGIGYGIGHIGVKNLFR